MKLKITVALIIAIVALTACRSSKEKAAFVEIPSENSLGSPNAHRNIENIYYSIPLLTLPLEHGNELIGSFTSLKPLDENTYRMLTDIGDMRSYYNGTNRAFRLPAKNGLSFLITGYKKDNKEWSFELYSLSDKLSPKDCLLLSSAEAAADGKSRIVQSFRITDDYRVVVAKHLNNTLIEQLTYMPDANGIIEELGVGKTQTVAFES